MPDASLSSLGRLSAAAITAFASTLLLTPIVRRIAVRYGWVCRATEDRWARRTVARLGGVAMFAGFIAAVLLWVSHEPVVWVLLAGSVLVFGVGLLDDIRRLPPYTKLLLQLLVGCLVVLGGIQFDLPQLPWLAVPLSVLWVVFVMNAFNLLDNMDGLAAGIGAITAAFCAVHAVLMQQWTVAQLAVAVGASSIGFLRYNFPPAKIFMGDSGSHFQGLTLAVIALMGSWEHPTQVLSILAVPTLVLAVPIFDTCFVTLQRLTHGQHLFVGGKDHVSHRLAILGLSVRRTVFLLYLVSAGLGLVGIAVAHMKPLPVLLTYVSVLAAMVLFGHYLSHVKVYRLSPAAEPERLSAGQGAGSTLIATMLMHKRRLAEVLVDFFIISSAYVFAHLLRFEGQLSADIQKLVIQSLPIALVIKLSCFALCGLYRGIWRYLGLEDLLAIFRAVSLGSLLTAVALVYLWRFQGYSRAVLVIDWLLCLIAIGGSRVAERLLDQWIRSTADRRIPVAIFGAGDSGERVLRHLKYAEQSQRRVVGLFDDDPARHGAHIHGCLVLGGRKRLYALVAEQGVREVLIAINDPPGELLHEMRGVCEPAGVAWKVVSAGISVA